MNCDNCKQNGIHNPLSLEQFHVSMRDTKAPLCEEHLSGFYAGEEAPIKMGAY